MLSGQTSSPAISQSASLSRHSFNKASSSPTRSVDSSIERLSCVDSRQWTLSVRMRKGSHRSLSESLLAGFGAYSPRGDQIDGLVVQGSRWRGDRQIEQRH